MPTISRVCGHCGEAYSVRFPSRNKKFCSGECLRQYKQAHPAMFAPHKTGRHISCAICGKDFWAEPNEIKRGRKYCSVACMGQATGNRLRGKPAPHVGQPPVVRVCKICGKTFPYYRRRKFRANNPGYCCSRACADRWHASTLAGRSLNAETRKKIGDALRGHKYPGRHQELWKKYHNTKQRSDAPRAFRDPELVNYHCAQCGTHWLGKKNGRGHSCQRHFCSSNCRSLWRQNKMVGEKNPFYIHGQASRPYPLTFRKMRAIIKERDGYLCQRCGLEEVHRSHHIHHIDFDKNNTSPDNLITLCVSCHALVTAKRVIGCIPLATAQEA